jgi:prepilin-type N-terminal cleavage/methylation domain-containing protein
MNTRETVISARQLLQSQTVMPTMSVQRMTGHRLRSERGFSLLEIMVGVTIVAIIATLGAPNFLLWQARTTLKQATMELMANINVARMAAMNRNQSITVNVALVGTQVVATFLNPNATQALPPYTMSVEVTGVAGNTNFTFNSLGMLVGVGAANQNIQLTTNRLQAGINTYTVQVSPGGKVRWCAQAAACQ